MKQFVFLLLVLSLVRTASFQSIFPPIQIVDLSLKTAIKDFTPSLYANLAKSTSNDNFVFSPFGLHLDLTMLHCGTKNNSKSRQELGATLGIGDDPKALMKSYKNVINYHRNLSSFQCGNHIWVDNDLTLSNPYQEMVTTYFRSEVTNLDFGESEAVQEINQWISNITKNEGQKVMTSFPYNTKMVTANALYLKANWIEPFEDIEAEFKTDNGKINVAMMESACSQVAIAEVNEGGIDLKVIIIPYKDNKFDMQIIFPKSVKDFNAMEEYIEKNPESHKKIFNDDNIFTSKNVSMKLPKFKIDSKFDTKEALQAMGIKDVFTASAELDNIAAGMPLMVSNVLHNSVVEVTKEATTGIAPRAPALVGAFEVIVTEKCDELLVLDSPFIFIIHDTDNGIPIFVGRMQNPQSP